MRKGRSRRKSKAPRPQASAKANRTTDVLRAQPGTAREAERQPVVTVEEVTRAEAVARHPDVRPREERTEPVSQERLAIRPPPSDPPAEPREEAAADGVDEVSIPPAGDLAAERFFSEADLTTHDDDEVDERALRKSAPHVVERRARLARYVTWAVGGAAVVCVAALVRTLTASAPAQVPAVAAGNALVAPATPEPKAAPVEVAATGTATTRPQPAEPAAVPAAEPLAPAEPAPAAQAVAAPIAAEPPATPNGPSAEPAAAPAAPAPAADVRSAAAEKKASQQALERGKLADAIAAGERAVALDPADGEAWLILGAAYQEKGNLAEARRCYGACVKEGKRGPIGECRAMLR